jgi:uncharacterized protein
MPYIPFHFFKFVFIGLTLLSQFIIFRIASGYLGRMGVGIKITHVFLPVAISVLNIPLLLIHLFPSSFYEGFLRTFVMMPYYAYETFSLALILAALVVFLARAPFRISAGFKKAKSPQVTAQPHSESRRDFLKKGALGLGAYTFVGSLHSIYSREDYTIDRVSLGLKDLPQQLDGLTISMISDIHSGMYMLEEDMAKYVDAVNALNADMVLIPGDFVTSKNSEVLPLARVFSGLKSKYGTYTCLGNHDFFADPDYIAGKLRDNGMKVLRNETEEIAINGAKMMLSGVDDGRHANFSKVSYEATSLNTTRILLCHKPYFFERAVSGRFDVMLSGHTHGGQIVLVDFLGVKLTPAALASPYISGRYKLGDSLMYVSRGIGTVGLPIRVNCPPEITLFTLRNKA